MIENYNFLKLYKKHWGSDSSQMSNSQIHKQFGIDKMIYFLNYFLKVTKTFDQMSPLSHGRSEALLNILLVMNLRFYNEQKL